MKSCHKIAESDKMPAEIRPKTFDSPGRLFDISNLSGSDSSRPIPGKKLPAAPEIQVSKTLHLPDPWLFDSEALIREIDRIRETALQVPINGDANATHFGLQQVINAAWTLRENLRYLLALHRDGQLRFGARSDKHQTVYDRANWLSISCLYITSP